MARKRSLTRRARSSNACDATGEIGIERTVVSIIARNRPWSYRIGHRRTGRRRLHRPSDRRLGVALITSVGDVIAPLLLWRIVVIVDDRLARTPPNAPLRNRRPSNHYQTRRSRPCVPYRRTETVCPRTLAHLLPRQQLFGLHHGESWNHRPAILMRSARRCKSAAVQIATYSPALLLLSGSRLWLRSAPAGLPFGTCASAKKAR